MEYGKQLTFDPYLGILGSLSNEESVMGMNTSVYVGPYILAKMSKQKHPEEQRVCSKNKRHDVDDKDKFCPHCGASVKTGVVQFERYQSFTDLMDKSDKELTKEERFVLRKFEYVSPEWVGIDDGSVEILLSEHTVSVDADVEGIKNLSPSDLSKLQTNPDHRDVMLLKNAIGYKSVEVKFGVLVQVA